MKSAHLLIKDSSLGEGFGHGHIVLSPRQRCTISYGVTALFGRKKTKDQPLTSSYIETEEGIIIRLSGRLDSVSSAEFQEEAVQKCRGRSTTLDMDGVTYLSSAGLRAILALDKAVGRNNKLSVINAKDAVKDVLDMSGFSEFI